VVIILTNTEIFENCILIKINPSSSSSFFSTLATFCQDYAKDIQREHRGSNLSSLLRNILNSVENEDLWLRLMYLYPDEITKDLIDIIKSDNRICKYLDMPIQHINNSVLKRMRRNTTSEDMFRTIATLREELPGVHIRTSLMVGFPGETEEQFEELLEFVKKAELDSVGAFIYSNEALAWSSRLDSQIPENVKAERYSRLMVAQSHVVFQSNRDKVKKKQMYDVVIDRISPGNRNRVAVTGRYFGQCPEVDGQVIINDIRRLGKLPLVGQRYQVQMTDFDKYDLIGRIIA